MTQVVLSGISLQILFSSDGNVGVNKIKACKTPFSLLNAVGKY